MSRQLLPDDIEALRRQIPIADPVIAKLFPTPGGKPRSGELATQADLYEGCRILTHIGVGPDESYILADKTSPHAVCELMLMSAGNQIRPGLDSHSPRFGATFTQLAGTFARFCRTNGLVPGVFWCYDPSTTDRQALVSQKRFHAHMTGRTRDEIDQAVAIARPAGEFDSKSYRRFTDEAATLGAMLIEDCLPAAGLTTLTPVPALSTPMSTAGALFKIDGGWSALSRPGFAQDLDQIHHALGEIYGSIQRTCLNGASGNWQRPYLDPGGIANLNLPLSSRSEAALSHYLGALQPAAQKPELYSGVPRNDPHTIHTLPLADLAYSVGIVPDGDSVCVQIKPSVFTEIGGCGVASHDGVIFRIERRPDAIMTPDELDLRQSFQHGVIGEIIKSPRAGKMLATVPSGRFSRKRTYMSWDRSGSLTSRTQK